MSDPTPLSPQLREYYSKAEAALAKGQHEYAIELLFQVTTLAPSWPDARRELHAAERQSWATSPPSSLHRQLAAVRAQWCLLQARLVAQRDPDRALSRCEEALRCHPDHIDALRYLAKALQNRGWDEAARSTLESLAKAQPNDVEALKQLGHIYAKSGALDKAKHCYERVLERDPQDHDALRCMKDLDALGTIQRSFGDSSADA